MKKLITLIILLLLILLFLVFGCVEMTREEKNLCYSLTTKSYTYVTNCKTENTCFEEVNSLFKTNLGYEQENRLYKLKNNIGRSWFYHNKGIDELKNLSNFCETGNIEELPGAINQTRFYLEEAFFELDYGLKTSFDIISIQEQILTQQKIDLLKEEQIYYSLIELRQILTDLDSGNTKNNNYVSYYLDKINKYNSSNASKKYNYLIEKNSFWIQAYNVVEGSILEKIGLGKKSGFPFLSDYFYGMFTSLENVFLKQESLTELQKLPAKEFMVLYSDLAGKKNSSIERLAILINEVSKNYDKIAKDAPILWNETNTLNNECNKLLNEINNNKQFDFIEKELIQNNITTKQDHEKIFNENKNKINSLKEKKSKYNLSLGEEISELKKIKNVLTELKVNLTLKKEKNILLLKEKCVERAQTIKKEKFITENESLEYLKQDLLFYTNNVLKNNEEIFYYCEEMIIKQKNLVEGITNYELLLSKKMDLTKECFQYLEQMLPISKEYELINLFENLKKENVTQENLFYFNDSCESIKKQLNNILNDDYFIQQIISTIQELHFEKNVLEKIYLYLNENPIKKEIEETENILKSFEKYFSNNKPKFDLLYSKKEKVYEDIIKELNSLKEKNEKYKIKVVEKLIKKEYINTILTDITNEQKLLLKIIITNPFSEINTRQSFFIEIDDGEIITLPNNIEQIKTGVNGFIVLTNIPEETTIIELNITKNIIINEEEKIIIATNQSGLIQRNLIVQTENCNKLLLKTVKPENMTNCVVFIDEKEVQHSIQGNEIFFVGENINKKTKIIVFIYTKKLIDLEMQLKTNQLLNNKSKKIEYDIITKNLINKKINGTLIIPINSNETINKINIYDELKINKQKEIINNELVLKNQEFLEKQTKKFELIIDIDSIENYYIEQLNELLIELKRNNEEEISKQIEQILLIEFNEKLIKEYENLIKKGNEKKVELDTINKKIIDDNIKLDKINEMIKEIEEKILEANQLELFEVSAKLSDIIKETKKEINENKLDNAILILEKTSFDIDEELLKKIKDLKKQLKKSNDIELQRVYEKIISEFEEIEKIIYFDPITAKKMFIETNKHMEEYFELEQKLIENEKELNEKNEKMFNELIKNTKELIILLEKQYESELDKTVKTKFVFPITKSRLEKIRQVVNSLEKYNEKDFTQVKNAYTELKIAFDEIKKFVILEYNESIDKKINSELLVKAKQEIDSNNYINALLILNSEPRQDFFLIGLIPIILIIFTAGIIKISLKKKNDKQAGLKQKVLEQWEEEEID